MREATRKKGRVVALIPAAGAGNRMGAGRPKQFLPLGGRPLLIHTLERFESAPGIDGILVVVAASEREEAARLLSGFSFHKLLPLTEGGAERSDSVRLGLKALDPAVEVVLVHDAVRPFVSVEKIEAVIQAARTFGAALLAVPEKATVKRVSRDVVEATLDRSMLYQAQTPQGFRYDLLCEAYEAAFREGVLATDDAALVERLGHPVHVVMGEEFNIKITTPEDLVLAEAILRHCQTQGEP